MDHFHYSDRHLHAEQVPLQRIVAQVGTPCYVYSRAAITRQWHAFNDAFGDYPHHIRYAVKANGNLAVLNLLARLGSGFDIVSGGELRRVLAAGGDASKTIFSGVGKQNWEMREALQAGIGCFNMESQDELHRIESIAGELGKVATVSVRLNPDVDAKTHPYISTGLHENKFGLPADEAIKAYRAAAASDNLRVAGVACHIGSQLTDLAPYRDAMQRVLAFIDRLQSAGITVDHLDFGGGLGLRYKDETPPSPAEYVDAILAPLRARKSPLPVVIEPGRAIVGDAGILLTRVLDLKRGARKSFCIVDAAMNDLLRPALYQSHHEIVAVTPRDDAPMEYDVVGTVCESADYLGKQRQLAVQPGDLLAVRIAGAYCTVMASNYNARPRPAEVMVDGDAFHIVRPRESLEAMYRDECTLPG